MRIALVHELLTMKGGAERVLKILADLFPDAPIYTLLYDEKKLGDWFPRNRVRPSSLQPTKSPFTFLPREAPRKGAKWGHLSPFTSLNHHLYLHRFPSAVEAWDFSEFDLVLSTSSAFVHGIITNGKPKHLCYVNSPARYLWDRTHDVLDRAGKGMIGLLKRWYLQRTFHTLRIWDTEAADRPDKLLAASKIIERRIELYWRRESDVLYPPIDDCWFENKAGSGQRAAGSSFYLVVSTLVPYKRIDLAIEACNALKLQLKIVGIGPNRRRLQKLAGPTIEFCGFRSNEELKNLYSKATTTIFPGDEDFGLVPLESMACGTPVIAFRSGGALETIVEGKTGEFFNDPTAESLLNSLQKFDQKKYSKEECRARAKDFSRAKFEAGVRNAIDKLFE